MILQFPFRNFGRNSVVSILCTLSLFSCKDSSQGQIPKNFDSTGSTESAESVENALEPLPQNVAFEAEAIVRSANNLSSPEAITALVNSAQSHNIKTLSVAVKQDEDDEYPSGTVFYNSDIAPKAFGNFDGLADLVDKAHAAGIQVRAWVPQFHDQVAFRKNPSWAMKALIDGRVTNYTGSVGVTDFFVNPYNPGLQAYQRSIIREIVTRYDVDSVMLDWIRFDRWNMDLSDNTRADFKAAYGYDPINVDFSSDTLERRQWQDWRTTQIANYVADVREDIRSIRPEVTLGVYVLPPAPDGNSDFAEIGQDPAKFKDSIDLISPMCYHTDWGYTDAWVYQTCIQNTFDKVGEGVEIVPSLDITYSSSTYQKLNRGIRSSFPNVARLSYFGYGTWTDSDLAKVDGWRGFSDKE